MSIFTVNEVDAELIDNIVDRGLKLDVDNRIRSDRLTCEMDIRATHNLVGLDLNKFADFDDANFGHDWYGIRRHLDRKAMKVTGCFLPRCAKPKGSDETK